jgi:hypothetical protein
MKKILNAIYEGLIDWAQMIHEYRQSQANKHYY